MTSKDDRHLPDDAPWREKFRFFLFVNRYLRWGNVLPVYVVLSAALILAGSIRIHVHLARPETWWIAAVMVGTTALVMYVILRAAISNYRQPYMRAAKKFREKRGKGGEGNDDRKCNSANNHYLFEGNDKRQKIYKTATELFNDLLDR